MSEGLQPGTVLDALKGVIDPEFRQDIVKLGMPKVGISGDSVCW